MILNDYGKIIQQEIGNIENDEIEIDSYVIMPNHVHMIITIHEYHTVETAIYGVSERTPHVYQKGLAMNYDQEGHAMNRVSTKNNIMSNKKSL